MNPNKVRCLILACGNTLRGDDGVGPFLCAWAEERFANDPRVRAIARQQWTPELTAELASAENVLFLDCSVDSLPGELRVMDVAPAAASPGLATHHTGAPELLALTQELFASLPSHAVMLTVGAGSIDIGELFSAAVQAALPEAQRTLEQIVQGYLDPSSSQSF